MKRTCPVIWYVFPAIGGPGIGRYWRGYHLARAWRSAGARPLVIGPGYHHYFLKPEPLAGTHNIKGITHHFIPTKPYGDQAGDRLRAILTFGVGLLTDRELSRLAADGAPNVIIYSSPYPFAYLAAHRLARRYGAALIFEVRDIWPLSLIEILGLPRWHPFVLASGACERIAYATADRVVSLLPEAAAHMVKRGLDVTNFAYIPNGVDVEQEGGTAAAGETPLIRRARDLASAGRFVIAHPGNMSVTTNLSPLLRAAKLLQDQGRADIAVLLVGRGPCEEALKAQAQDLGLANIEFFPQVDKGEVTALLRLVHAGYAALAPSPIYRFGISLNKLFDYMLAELPIVFACDAPNRMFDKTGAGIRVSAGDPLAIADAITRLANLSSSERTRMGAQGRAFVATEHDYRMLAERYMRLFVELRPHAFT